MSYTTFLLDLDHTLLDSDASESLAFASTLASIGVMNAEQHAGPYRRINLDLWAAVERGELLPQQVKVRRFELLIEQQGLDADANLMAEEFVKGLGANGELYDGARDVLQSLSADASLALVTNGLSEVQRARIARLDLEQYFDAITISAEVGTAKPGTDIFDLTFAELGNPAKSTAVMVGDSLTSDIRGGANFQIDTCWYNPHGKDVVDSAVTHEIRELNELPGFLAA